MARSKEDTATNADSVSAISLLMEEIRQLKAELEAVKAKPKQASVEDAEAARKREELHKYWNEPVEVRLFKDSGKYKDDVTVCVNGKVWQIKRGMTVTVPRKVKEVLDESYAQDQGTAMMMEQQEQEFLRETERRGV